VQRIVDRLLYFHHRKIERILSRAAKEFNHSGRVIVEIGAGAKPEAKHFPEAFYVSTDFVPRQGISLVQAAGHLAFRQQSVDLIVCKNVLEHVPDPQPVLQEAHRILRKGGCLFLVTPFLFPLHDAPHDFFRYTEYSLKPLLCSYSKVLLYRILWVPLPKHIFDRFVLYYVSIARK
jgi:SAM-dependent methyltransferase